MNMKPIRPVTLQDLITIVPWRNAWLESLRTPTMTTEESQKVFFNELMSNPYRHRYYAWSTDDGLLVAVGGLTYIQWENGIAEISLIVNPKYTRRGVGENCVADLLRESLERLRLYAVHGEVYTCNQVGLSFWTKICEKYHTKMVRLENRKYWNGQLWPSRYFSIGNKAWIKWHD